MFCSSRKQHSCRCFLECIINHREIQIRTRKELVTDESECEGSPWIPETNPELQNKDSSLLVNLNLK